MSLPRRRINEIVLGKRSRTADTALRLPPSFGTNAQSWMNLQTYYDFKLVRESVAKFSKPVVPVPRELGSRDAAHS